MASRILLLSFLVAGVPMNAPAALAQAAAIPELAARTTPAVVLIRVVNSGGQETAVASGFLVQDGRIVTNAHVVAGAHRLDIYDEDGQLVGTAHHAEALDSVADLAILPTPREVSATLPLAGGEPSVGETVLAIGAPEGLSHTVSMGIVSAVRTLDGREVIQITAPLSSGSSGGPVVNVHGEVIGVSVGMFRRGQNLNFAVPVRALHALLADPPRRIAFSQTRSVYGVRAALHPRPLTSIPPHLPDIVPGGALQGSLDVDAHEVNGKLARLYRFRGTAGETLTVTLRSTDFDAYLEVGWITPSGPQTLAADDDGAGGTDARIVFTPPADGEYLVLVTTFSAAERGDFVLSVDMGSGAGAVAPMAGR
jgi:hypothetical protein